MTNDTKIHSCPEDDCKTNGRRTRLALLADRGPDGSWRTFIDPADSVQILRCPTHGRFYLAPGSDTPTKEDPAA